MTPFTFLGLTRNPFSKEGTSVKDSFHSRDFQEMTGALSHLIRSRGIGVFTSPPGNGKTFVLRAFMHDLNKNLYRPDYICMATVSVGEFYKQFCDLLGVPAKGGKPRMFRAIQEQIWYLYKEKGTPLILAIDEAQYLNTAILNDLKMLMNYDYDSLNCFTLILCGEAWLNSTLRKPVHEALRQRISVHYEFQGLSDEEVPEYVRHKIRCAGGSEQILNEAAMAALNSMSQHNPRVIDNIMNDAMLIAMQQEKHIIDADVIMDATNHQAF